MPFPPLLLFFWGGGRSSRRHISINSSLGPTVAASCFEVHHLRFRQRGSFRTRAPSGRECSWLWNNWCFPCKRKQFEKCRNTSFLRRRKQFAGVGFSTSRRCSCFLLRSITATFLFSPPLFFLPQPLSPPPPPPLDSPLSLRRGWQLWQKRRREEEENS